MVMLTIMNSRANTQTCEIKDCDDASCVAVADKKLTLPELRGLDVNAEHANHDHVAEAHSEDDAVDGIELTPKMLNKIGLKVRKADSGKISKSAVFPAEIRLNRDRAAAVSASYASIVRQLFAEIGGRVKKGDVLASLKNRETLAVYTVSAPLDGIIISKDISVGESAEEGQVMFEIADISTVWADISVFPQYQHRVRKGLPVEFTAHDGHTAQGVIKYVSPIVSSETRTFTARCVLERKDGDFTPGAFVRARIAVDTAVVAVAVERDAVQTIEGETVVFVPGEHGFQPKTVKTGLADDSFIEIRSGLKPEESYVSAGAFTLKAEMVTSGMDSHAGHGH